ncbi:MULTISPECIES: hypothetical protein [Roseivirga]|uniref:Uncharacterized protein n=1 Tax=Roseivirga spongicola TaxID=333140 RepID=A0A150XIC0_9BACT|nr:MULTISPECIES: hypothetical protein [Roseivirga]KYG78432.1 hypothetical protein AWW68_06600 [Roseivirga spongicola]MBO6660744.1 hypothetical protein [Roseivirga sp.]MBO6762251.1 hypothetical protein [Roseivirga sp.]MBO6909272.1 hypothetical protein [Roseivirga sp.]WPZ12180.1 hypothetical protein T7867_08655 [Roseivirga spongicola]
MSTFLTEEKAKLISKINEIKDQSVIDDLMRLLAINFDDSIYLLSDEQRANVMEAREQIRKGQGIDSEQADGEIDQWLNE